MNNNTQHDQNKPSRNLVGCLIILIFALPVLYVLSIGPAFWLIVKIERSWYWEVCQTFYAPLIWLHDHTFLQDPLEWYVSLFVPLDA